MRSLLGTLNVRILLLSFFFIFIVLMPAPLHRRLAEPLVASALRTVRAWAAARGVRRRKEKSESEGAQRSSRKSGVVG